MPFGKLILRRFNGTETYDIISAAMLLYTAERGFCLNLEIECDLQGTKTTTDTVDFPAAPNIEVSIYREQFDTSDLVGQTFKVPSTYDDEFGDYVSRFYYYEHEGIDNNVIEFLAREQDGRYHVHWTGTAMDPNFYDGSKPDTVVEIDARFLLKT
jgi:hypothetical protein